MGKINVEHDRFMRLYRTVMGFSGKYDQIREIESAPVTVVVAVKQFADREIQADHVKLEYLRGLVDEVQRSIESKEEVLGVLNKIRPEIKYRRSNPL